LSFDWPIETAGKRDKRIHQGEWLAEAARQNVFAAAWQVRGDLRKALIEYGAAQRRAKASDDLITAQQKVLTLLEQRLSAGAVSADELSATRIALVKSQSDAGAAERELGVARSHLAEALGVPASALAGQEFTDAGVAEGRAFASEELVTAQQLSLQTRPDILSALATYEASQSQLQLEIAKQYPDVHLGSGYLYDLGENKWDLTLGVELPILNQNQGSIAEAAAARREAAAELTALQSRVIAEIDTAAAENEAAAGLVENLRRVNTEVQKHLDLMKAQADAGEADQLDYQTALLDARTSDLALIDAQAEAATAAGQLEDAFQVPFPNLSAVQKDIHPLTSLTKP
jgi:outer membrane protein TolC